MFDVGDTVALSGSLVMQLATEHPEIFEHLRRAHRHAGAVTQVQGNSVHVDVGMPHPLIVDIDPAGPSQLLQVLRKAAAASPPACEDDEVADADADLRGTLTTSRNEPGATSQRILGPAVFVTHPAAGQQHSPRSVLPDYVRTAQWLMLHFTEFKKFAITQDINEGHRRQATRPVRAQNELEELYAGDNRLPVRVELSAAETRLYEESLAVLGDWLAKLQREAAEPDSD